MNTAHNTLIQFLHDHSEYEICIEREQATCKGWFVGIYTRHSDQMPIYGYGSSYESACANLAAQLPKL